MNWIDPWGLAWIAYRPLNIMGLKIGGDMQSVFHQNNNTVIGHQQIFFNVPQKIKIGKIKTEYSNIGLFSDNSLAEDSPHLFPWYNMVLPIEFDDYILARAVEIVASNRPAYALDGQNQYNCQDFIGNVIDVYGKLISSKWRGL